MQNFVAGTPLLLTFHYTPYNILIAIVITIIIIQAIIITILLTIMVIKIISVSLSLLNLFGGRPMIILHIVII